MARSIHHQRNRDSRTAGVLLAVTYWIGSRRVFELTIRDDGVHVRLTCDPAKVSGADKEQAAAWLVAYKPRLTHDQRFSCIWGGASA